MFRAYNPYRTDNPFYIAFFAIFTILTLGIPSIFFYDYFMENAYWYNRWKFRTLLKEGKVKITKDEKVNYNGSFYIHNIDIEIESTKYQLWLWSTGDITLSSEDGKESYIGLFTGSPITNWLKRDAVRRIKLLIG